MIANAGLVIRPVVGLLFLLAGIFLWRRSRTGGTLITLGAVLFLGAELYGLVVLRPFVGRSFDEAWQEQLSTVDAVGTVGLLLSSVGLLLELEKTMKNLACLLVVLFTLAAFPATAAPRLANVSVKPMDKGNEVLITVTIERPTPLDLVCSVSIDPGDGNRGPTVSWDVAERRTKTTRYDYKKPGTYKMKVTGAGNDPCSGSRDIMVTVGGVKPAAPVSKAACPDGWELASSKGAAYTCKVKTPTLACAEGTKYFAGKGEIGCR